QAMYDAIQKLDKKFDLLHRKVSEIQHTRVKPLLLKPVIIRVALQNGHAQVNSTVKPAQQSFQFESQQPVGRQSPPLPTIVSTHSLHSSYTATNGMPDLSPQSNLAPSIVESSVNVASSPVASSSMPAPSEPIKCFCFTKEFVGDPVRNVKVLGNYLVKARQKTKPKYAARYLVRVMFPKKTLMCSIMGASARGRRTLDPIKIAAIREFLATNFPTYDLSEHGKDWKTCITNVNAMIRCLRSETKTDSGSCLKHRPADCSTISIWGILKAYAFLLLCLFLLPYTSHCVDLSYNEDNGGNSQNSQKMTSSTTDKLQNSGLDKFPEAFHTPSVGKQQSLEPMEPLGSPWRNVQLPFSVIYVAKGKTRPELSARYLIRHMFTEDVLVKSNVYGSLDRGMNPLDSNKINALRDFLQENFPSFDLSESGFDWKACVAAINGTIRSLRHELKKAAVGI
ncbi:BEND2 protein, partial [Pitta sordida]|nr:BEND2 protein [Pitta sordida]